jgi:hypothetical protein
LGDSVSVKLGDDGAFLLNDWSFAQICRFSGISKDTVNRLSPETASRALQETLPGGDKPIQLLTTCRPASVCLAALNQSDSSGIDSNRCSY